MMNPRLIQMLAQLKQNPAQMLARRFRMPPNLSNNPNEIIQYLLNSGQISQDQVNNAMQMRNNLM